MAIASQRISPKTKNAIAFSLYRTLRDNQISIPSGTPPQRLQDYIDAVNALVKSLKKQSLDELDPLEAAYIRGEAQLLHELAFATLAHSPPLLAPTAAWIVSHWDYVQDEPQTMHLLVTLEALSCANEREDYRAEIARILQEHN